MGDLLSITEMSVSNQEAETVVPICPFARVIVEFLKIHLWKKLPHKAYRIELVVITLLTIAVVVLLADWMSVCPPSKLLCSSGRLGCLSKLVCHTKSCWGCHISGCSLCKFLLMDVCCCPIALVLMLLLVAQLSAVELAVTCLVVVLCVEVCCSVFLRKVLLNFNFHVVRVAPRVSDFFEVLRADFRQAVKSTCNWFPQTPKMFTLPFHEHSSLRLRTHCQSIRSWFTGFSQFSPPSPRLLLLKREVAWFCSALLSGGLYSALCFVLLKCWLCWGVFIVRWVDLGLWGWFVVFVFAFALAFALRLRVRAWLGGRVTRKNCSVFHLQLILNV